MAASSMHTRPMPSLSVDFGELPWAKTGAASFGADVALALQGCGGRGWWCFPSQKPTPAEGQFWTTRRAPGSMRELHRTLEMGMGGSLS